MRMIASSGGFASVLCWVILGLVLGCTADSKHGMVKGNVTLDGQPLKDGVIRFQPVDGTTATADAQIVDGKFSGRVPPGEKRIVISSQKVVGKRKMYDSPDSPVVDRTEELLPKRYNEHSELKASVTLGAQELPPFELTSK